MSSREPEAIDDGNTRFKIARKISDIGNAITFSLLVGVLFSFIPPQVFPSWAVFLIAFLVMILTPGAILVYAMKYKGVDFDFTDRSSRTPFYLSIEACYAAGILIFSPLIIPSWSMFNLSIVSTLLNGVILLINFKWKISAHAAGAAGPATGIALVFGWWTLFIFGPVVLAIIWSRLVLKKHTIMQLVFGTIVAVACYSLVFAGLYPLNIF